VEFNNEEEGEESDEEAELANSASAKMWNLEVQELVKNLVSRKALETAVRDMDVDLEKMPLSKLQRHKVNGALAQLSLMQKLLRKGEKQTGKDIEKVAHISQSVRRLVPMADSYEPWQIDTVPALKQSAALLEDLGKVCVAASMRNRVRSQLRAARALEAQGGEAAESSAAPTPTKMDALYRSLRSNIVPLAPSHTSIAHIRQMVESVALGAEAGSEAMELSLEHVYAINCAGAEARYAPFKRLPNRMLLWKGARQSSMASILSQGLNVPTPEAPSASYPFGKGIYLQDSAAFAAQHCHLSGHNDDGLLLLCEVALGSSKEEIRPSCMRRAPHAYHSVIGRGKYSFDPADLKMIKLADADCDLKVVLGPPKAEHGSADSCIPYNQYVVFESSQVLPRFLVKVKRKAVN
jgi:hypothetical protein